MNKFFCSLIQLYMFVLVARALLSWFPIDGRSKLVPVQRVLFDLTEPVLSPLRRVIPPAGNFDLSFLVVFFIFLILRNAVCGA